MSRLDPAIWKLAEQLFERDPPPGRIWSSFASTPNAASPVNDEPLTVEEKDAFYDRASRVVDAGGAKPKIKSNRARRRDQRSS